MALARSGWSRFGIIGALLALAACSEPIQQDYTKRFPIGAKPETVSLTAPDRGSAEPLAGGADAARFRMLVAGYLDRGHGPLTITIAAGAPETQAAALRHRLVAAGIPASAIQVERGGRDARGTITLRYTRYAVVLPTCGDWSAPMGFNPSNLDDPEFGCSVQRNLGLMLADPGDIVSMRTPQPTDSANAERVIRAYRSGAVTEAKQGTIQDSADQNVATGSTTGASTAVPSASH
ncbi:MAG TPA: CpaD family pilus assembly lipoprotein [Stellaceae bacterium]|nr:CpaD family pilus assembly lipoprotein [Stellaceae bacterium]